MRIAALTILSVAAVLTAAPAHATPSTDALAGSGLLGPWAFDCAKPHSNTNAYVTYIVTDGKALERVQMGTVVDRTTEMSGVTFTGGKLSYHYMQNGEQNSVELLIEASRHRTWSSSSAVPFGPETVYVKDGIGLFGEHTPTEWFNRCK